MRKVQFANDVKSFSLFVKGAVPTATLVYRAKQTSIKPVQISSDLEIKSQFSRLNLSFSSGRNLTMSEELTTIPDDVFCVTDVSEEIRMSGDIAEKAFSHCMRKHISETKLESAVSPIFF